MLCFFCPGACRRPMMPVGPRDRLRDALSGCRDQYGSLGHACGRRADPEVARVAYSTFLAYQCHQKSPKPLKIIEILGKSMGIMENQ